MVRVGSTYSNHRGGAHLDLTHSPGHNGLQHRAPIIMQQMDLIDDEQLDELGVDPVPALPRDDVSPEKMYERKCCNLCFLAYPVA